MGIRAADVELAPTRITEQAPFKSLQHAYLQHTNTVEYLVKKREAEPAVDGAEPIKKEEWKPAAKAALKKAANFADQQKKKDAKAAELAIREKKLEEERQKVLEEAKKIVLEEDTSLPKAVRLPPLSRITSRETNWNRFA